MIHGWKMHGNFCLCVGLHALMKMLVSMGWFLIACGIGDLMAESVKTSAYDPLKVSAGDITSISMEVKDPERKRSLPIRVYLPKSEKPAPVILFSHGLGGSCDNNPYLGNHWAKRGYVVVFIQHPGSDEAVWREAAAVRRMAAMKQAASLDNFLLRAEDVPAVLNALEKFNHDAAHQLSGRMNLDRIGMSGHSFGANTTQCVSGQNFAGRRVSFLEPRIDASLMMSPAPPAVGDAAKAFSSIRIPCLLMTGTRDDSPIGGSTAADRLNVFPHLRQAPAWQVVFDGATHMDFGEHGLRGQEISGTRYHRAILALSTAFWDSQLRGDPAAAVWLKGDAARSVMDRKDRWEMNEQALR
jgi:predicted dienelactone hydrolase